MPRHAEIAGAGFGGLIAAIALAERGWSVRVHERTPLLRAEGFSISIQKNMAKVLEAIGVLETVRAGGARIDLREVRDVRDRVIMATPTGGRAWRVSRLHIIRTLAERAQELGVEIGFESAATDVEPNGTLTISDGRQRRADLVVCADGINSVLRDRLGLLRRRTSFRDGAMRVMIPMREGDAEGRLTER